MIGGHGPLVPPLLLVIMLYKRNAVLPWIAIMQLNVVNGTCLSLSSVSSHKMSKQPSLTVVRRCAAVHAASCYRSVS